MQDIERRGQQIWLLPRHNRNGLRIGKVRCSLCAGFIAKLTVKGR